jgi:Fic family protein
LDAALVTPPPDVVPALVRDLVAYANRTDVDPVTQAAVAHAQFEVIHPFADGNGRVGRVLVSWVLTRRLRLETPPPVSLRLAADLGGYLAGLTLYRLGSADAWVRWFADAVAGAGRAQRTLVHDVRALHEEWRTTLQSLTDRRSVRADSTAFALLALLPRFVVVSARQVAEHLGVSDRAAATSLATLVQAGVLVEVEVTRRHGPGRPARRFASPALLALTSASGRR